MTLVLVRHASAGDPDEWQGDDRLRPLDKKGRKQAARLPEVLAGIRSRGSSAARTCAASRRSSRSRERGLEIEPADELGVEHQQSKARALLAALLADDAVACVHGGIERALGFDLRFRKGAVWLFRDALERPEVLAER